ncbi:DNA-binding protein WhiA [Allofustis seminis]|uniref:DNA-binding protein WhiA n=1 Tax=Allofustis seminis TaxID=166939 RepID=UPI00035D1FFF|nr:DNA-binding protein WhiA [Allofustis seminis]
MSYAAEVKNELTRLPVHYEHAKAELAAFIRLNGILKKIDGEWLLNIETENATIARRMYTLIKRHYEVQSEIIVRKKMKLKKNNVYIIRLRSGSQPILADLKILDGLLYHGGIPKEFKEDDQKARSYLRGAFLARGSVNSPETGRYHLEIYSPYEEHNNDLLEMINHFHLNAKSLQRKNGGYIVYIKEAEKIADFLRVIGAVNSLFKFEDIRIVRDMRNSVNRLVNCENANINKAVNAAQEQIEDITLVDEMVGLHTLPTHLKEIAYLRLENPEASLKQLGELYPDKKISKSAVNHRLRKLRELADTYR